MKRVILRLNGGLGNQMFQFAFARSLAEKHGAELLIDRSLYKLDYVPEEYRLDEFDLKVRFTSGLRSLLNRILLSPKIPQFVINTLTAWLEIDIVRDGDDLPHKPREILLSGYFQKPHAFEADADYLRKTFVFKLESEEAKKYAEEIENSYAVAMHIRRGDYASVKTFRESIGLLDLDYFLSCIDELENSVGNVSIYVFSNDHDWVEAHILPKVRDAKLVKLGQYSTDVEELALMQKCRHFIVANSTFSWWPAFLSNHEEKVVLAPEPWFRNDGEEANDLLLDDWQLMRASWDVDLSSSIQDIVA